LNVDDNGQTAMRYNVRGIPTLLVFKGGRWWRRRVGAMGKATFKSSSTNTSIPAPAVAAS